MSKKIRVLSVLFDTELRAFEIPSFRGAMVEKVGKEEVLFHNHLPGGFLYRYPLIQYKTIGGKPAIICIEEGVDHIHKYFEKKDWSIRIGDRILDMKIASLSLNSYSVNIQEVTLRYSLTNWLALNQENSKKYKQIESLTQRVAFLENLLKANILSFAKGIEWHVENTIEVTINTINAPKVITFKSQKLLSFNAKFSSNVHLPNYIGLGKGSSVGFGILMSENKNHN